MSLKGPRKYTVRLIAMNMNPPGVAATMCMNCIVDRYTYGDHLQSSHF